MQHFYLMQEVEFGVVIIWLHLISLFVMHKESYHSHIHVESRKNRSFTLFYLLRQYER